jgi:hypothetical protein
MASVYIGFAVADGTVKIIVVECVVAMASVVVAAAGSSVGVAPRARARVNDAWHQRSRFVSDTRWWPPFCAAVD